MRALKAQRGLRALTTSIVMPVEKQMPIAKWKPCGLTYFVSVLVDSLQSQFRLAQLAGRLMRLHSMDPSGSHFARCTSLCSDPAALFDGVLLGLRQSNQSESIRPSQWHVAAKGTKGGKWPGLLGVVERMAMIIRAAVFDPFAAS